MNTMHKRLLGVTAAAASIGLVGASTATAQPIDQDGLVNVAVDDLTVQVPISAAANICGLAVNVLARGLNTGDVDCAATSEAGADGTASRDGGPTTQNGLVNVALTDTLIQVPVSVAATSAESAWAFSPTQRTSVPSTAGPTASPSWRSPRRTPLSCRATARVRPPSDPGPVEGPGPDRGHGRNAC